MGLDLVVEACAKPGHEAAWRRFIERSFADEALSEAEIAQFGDISIPAYTKVEVPRVGSDPEADAWVIAELKPATPEAAQTVLSELRGQHVPQLARSDGVPIYSHGGLYDGVDETSFRGEFLKGCVDVIDARMLDQAWEHKWPDDAVAYGQALLAAADAAETSPRKPARGLWARLGLAKRKDPVSFAEQLDIVRAAGRWHVFWGERGHPIRAYF